MVRVFLILLFGASTLLGATTQINEGTQTKGALPTAQGGLKTGGSTNELLTKASATDYDQSWQTISALVNTSYTSVARVDPSGSDSTGVVGNPGKPFLTVQGAINAIEAGSFTLPIVDIGNNKYLGTTVTTSLQYIRFVGAADEIGVPGFATYYSYVCDDLVLTNSTSAIVELSGCEVETITATASGTLGIFLEDAGVVGTSGQAVTAAGPIKIGGNGYIRGQVNDSVTSTSAGPITIRNAYVDDIDSTGSNVTAEHLSVIRRVLHANDITLKDSRISGTNSASGTTTYQDTFLIPPTRTVNGHAISSNVTVTPTDLSLVIGTNTQAWDADLDTWATKTPYAGSVVVTTGKTFTDTNNLTLSGTDGSTLNIGSGGTLGSNAFNSTSYLTGNQTITLSGDVTGSGATAITTTLASIPTAVPMAGSLLATAITAPGTPAAGKGSIYVDSTSKNIAVKDDAGVVKHGVQTDTGASNNFVTAISDAGAITKAQPSFTNLSGSATDAQVPDGITLSQNSVTDYFAFTAIAAPGTPAAGVGRIYVDSTSKNLAVKDDAGTVKHGIQTKASVASNFVTAINDAGSVSAAQPAFSDISGTASGGQIPTLNQNTTGSAASLSITGQTALLTFTGPTSTNRAKAVRDAADTILELGGSYTPTGTWTSLTMVTPVLGTPTSGNLANCTFPTGSTLQAWDTQLDSLAALSYTGNALKTIRVNAGESGFEFSAAGSGTVTNTGGNLTSNSVVLGAGTADTKVSTGIITDGASKLTLGLNTSTLGQIKLFGSTSGDATIQPPVVAGTATVVTLPNASSTLPIFGQQITFSGPTAARTLTLRDATDTVLELGGSYTPTGTWTNMTMVTPALGTPSAIVLTNATGFPATILTTTSTNNHVTGKGNDPRVTSIASNATWSPNADTDDVYEITAQAAAATTISNPSGSPVDGQRLLIRAKDNGTARALTWSGTQWRVSSDLALPTTTVLSKTLYCLFIYNSTDTKWDLLAYLNNF